MASDTWDDDFYDTSPAVIGFAAKHVSSDLTETWKDVDLDSGGPRFDKASLRSDTGLTNGSEGSSESSPASITEQVDALRLQLAPSSPPDFEQPAVYAEGPTNILALMQQLQDILEPIGFDQQAYDRMGFYSSASDSAQDTNTLGPKDAQACIGEREYEEQRQLLEWALAFAKGKSDLREECAVHTRIAKLARSARKAEEATRAIARALGCQEQLERENKTHGPRTIEGEETFAGVLLDLALLVHQVLSDSKLAVLLLQSALECANRTRSRQPQLQVLKNLGCLERAAGNVHASVHYFVQLIKSLVIESKRANTEPPSGNTAECAQCRTMCPREKLFRDSDDGLYCVPCWEEEYGPTLAREKLALQGASVPDGDGVNVWAELGAACSALGEVMIGELDDHISALFLFKAAFSAASKASDHALQVNTAAGLRRATRRWKLSRLKGADEDDGIEDWDLELELEERDCAKLGISTHDVQLLLEEGATKAAPKGHALPDRYRIISTLLGSGVHQQRYPPAPMTYSASHHEELRSHPWWRDAWQLSQDGVETEAFLKTYISSQGTNYVSAMANAPTTLNDVKSKVHYLDKFSHPWGAKYYEFCLQAYRSGKTELFWSMVQVRLHRCLQEYFDSVSRCVPSQQLDDDEAVERLALFNLSLHILSVAAKLWSTKGSQRFSGFVKIIKKLVPKDSGHIVELLEVETMAATATQEDASVRATVVPRLYALYQAGAHGARPLTHRDAACDEVDLLSRTFCPSIRAGALQAAALASLDLFLSGLSPASAAPLSAGSIPPIPDSLRLPPTPDGELPRILTDGLYRAEMMLERYSELQGISWLRAKVAYVIALRLAASPKAEHALIREQLLMDCLYILSRCPTLAPGAIARVSELGERALVEFAEAMLKTRKFTYAVVAFESAITCRKLRKKKDFFELNRRLAEVCMEHDDAKRALTYYLKVLERAKTENNVAEFIFVSEKLAEIFSNYGSFERAKSYMGGACAVLAGGAISSIPNEQMPQAPDVVRKAATAATPVSLPIDSRLLTLLLKLVAILVDAGSLLKALRVLKALECSELPRGGRAHVLVALIKLYLKMRNTSDCATAIKALSTESATAARGIPSSFLAIATIRNLCHSGDMLKAISVADSAIQIEPRINVLAHIHYLRGKALHLVALPSSPLDFPIHIGQAPGSDHKVMSSAWEVVRESVEALHRAYELFRKIEDDRRVAKTVCQIAHVYLEQFWPQSMLLNIPLERMLRSSNGDPIFGARKPERQTNRKIYFDGPMSDTPRSEDAAAQPLLQAIEEPATLALELAIDRADLYLLLDSYLNMMELRALMGSLAAARAFYFEARDLFVTVFFDATVVGGKHSFRPVQTSPPPGLAQRLERVSMRLVRFLLTQDGAYINLNLHVFDIYFNMQIQHMRALQRAAEEDGARPESTSTSKSKGASSGETESIMPAFHWAWTEPLAGEGADDEQQLGFQVWTTLHRIKANATANTRGAIRQEELQRRNHQALRKLLKNNGWSKPVIDLFFTGVSSVISAGAERLFVLELQDVLAVYLPRKEKAFVQRFGGRNAPLDVALDLSKPRPGAEKALPSGELPKPLAPQDTTAVLQVLDPHRPAFLSKEALQWLSLQLSGPNAALGKPAESQETATRAMLERVGSETFRIVPAVSACLRTRPLSEVQPHVAKSRSTFSCACFRRKQNQVLDTALSEWAAKPEVELTCSISLRLIPWEILWPDLAIHRRLHGACEFNGRAQPLPLPQAQAPRCICFSPATDTTNRENKTDNKRLSSLLLDYIAGMHHSTEAASHSLAGLAPNSSSAKVTQAIGKKYKSVDLFEAPRLHCSLESALEYLESRMLLDHSMEIVGASSDARKSKGAQQPPSFFLFSYSDLLFFEPLLFALLEHPSLKPVIIVPDGYWQRTLDLLSSCEKELCGSRKNTVSRSSSDIIRTIVQVLRCNYLVPLIVYNLV